ncbi:hypothetical protein M427DRAFT_156192 [Gonapodya prolifera JEL478]|uniref:Mediator of RNA polymerase II transcription subunit 25 n=1 Tax=Gonapodya prolifera (strain JEL478) TaxID=1344416 RepID=A0A139ABR9_GONPJ|nr:hypothetical protein M427DRAFT_156192 [Gonapodya prolifera JEL478]|eukprot:KXS14210.1 hypothetical protein M427DRAFT_156192 [Gonapodya prolifera JEL478]
MQTQPPLELVLVVENSVHLLHHLQNIRSAVLDPLVAHLRPSRIAVVLYGDRQPFAKSTIIRRAFAPADQAIPAWLDQLADRKSYYALKGASPRNAVVDGLVAAVELIHPAPGHHTTSPRRASEPQPTRHIILIASRPGLNSVAVESEMEEFDRWGLQQVVGYLRKNRVQFSLVLTQRGIQDLEDFTVSVNKDITPLRDIKLPPHLAHFVIKIAGVDLPVAKPKAPIATSTPMPSPTPTMQRQRADSLTTTPNRQPFASNSMSVAASIQQTIARGQPNAALAQAQAQLQLNQGDAMAANFTGNQQQGFVPTGIPPGWQANAATVAQAIAAQVSAGLPRQIASTSDTGGQTAATAAATALPSRGVPLGVLQWQGDVVVGNQAIPTSIFALAMRKQPNPAALEAHTWPSTIRVTAWSARISQHDLKTLLQSGKYPVVRVAPSAGFEKKFAEVLGARLKDATALIKFPTGKTLLVFQTVQQAATMALGALFTGDVPFSQIAASAGVGAAPGPAGGPGPGGQGGQAASGLQAALMQQMYMQLQGSHQH